VEQRTSGIILRTRLLTETSLIVHWLTPDLGRIATVAKGARRPKSNFRGKLDLFYVADFSFTRSAKSELHNLREVVLRETHVALREDFHKLRQAAYAVALIEHATETETPIPEVFELMSALLSELISRPGTAVTMFAFELKLLEQLGIAPELVDAKLSPGTRIIAAKLASDDWTALRQLKLSAQQVEELRQFLHGFLIYHLGKIPRGRAEALHI
jgi:DNA repair protein RecO (recombination protein O)